MRRMELAMRGALVDVAAMQAVAQVAAVSRCLALRVGVPGLQAIDEHGLQN